MKRLIFLAIFATTVSYGQGVRFDNHAWSARTNVPTGAQADIFTVPYATVRICTDSSCATPVAVYNNIGLTAPALVQPLTADSLGRYGFWAASGTYWSKVCSPAGVCNQGYITLAGAGAGSGSVTAVSAGNLAPLFTTTVTNPTSTPTIAYALSTAATSTIFGNFSGSTAAPQFYTLAAGTNMTFGVSGTTLTLNATGSGSGGVSSINSTTGAFTFTGSGVSCSTTTCTFSGGGGSGGVSSVGLTMPSIFGVAGTPITSSGTLAVTFNTQTAHTFLAGPATGSAVAPTFRTIGSGDLPTATTSNQGAVQPDGTTITISGATISAVNPISGQTLGFIPLAGSGATLTSAAPADYGITTACCFTFTKPIDVAVSGGAGGGVTGGEGTAPTVATGQDFLWADSTSHRWLLNNNNGATAKVAGMLTGATGIITGTALTNACDTGTVTATGAIVGSPVLVSTTDGTDVGANFIVRASVTATGTVTVSVCNPTAVSATPPSKSYNVAVMQ